MWQSGHCCTTNEVGMHYIHGQCGSEPTATQTGCQHHKCQIGLFLSLKSNCNYCTALHVNPNHPKSYISSCSTVKFLTSLHDMSSLSRLFVSSIPCCGPQMCSLYSIDAKSSIKIFENSSFVTNKNEVKLWNLSVRTLWTISSKSSSQLKGAACIHLNFVYLNFTFKWCKTVLSYDRNRSIQVQLIYFLTNSSFSNKKQKRNICGSKT